MARNDDEDKPTPPISIDSKVCTNCCPFQVFTDQPFHCPKCQNLFNVSWQQSLSAPEYTLNITPPSAPSAPSSPPPALATRPNSLPVAALAASLEPDGQLPSTSRKRTMAWLAEDTDIDEQPDQDDSSSSYNHPTKRNRSVSPDAKDFIRRFLDVTERLVGSGGARNSPVSNPVSPSTQLQLTGPLNVEVTADTEADANGNVDADEDESADFLDDLTMLLDEPFSDSDGENEDVGERRRRRSVCVSPIDMAVFDDDEVPMCRVSPTNPADGRAAPVAGPSPSSADSGPIPVLVYRPARPSSPSPSASQLPRPKGLQLRVRQAIELGFANYDRELAVGAVPAAEAAPAAAAGLAESAVDIQHRIDRVSREIAALFDSMMPSLVERMQELSVLPNCPDPVPVPVEEINDPESDDLNYRPDRQPIFRTDARAKSSMQSFYVPVRDKREASSSYDIRFHRFLDQMLMHRRPWAADTGNNYEGGGRARTHEESQRIAGLIQIGQRFDAKGAVVIPKDYDDGFTNANWSRNLMHSSEILRDVLCRKMKPICPNDVAKKTGQIVENQAPNEAPIDEMNDNESFGSLVISVVNLIKNNDQTKDADIPYPPPSV